LERVPNLRRIRLPQTLNWFSSLKLNSPAKRSGRADEAPKQVDIYFFCKFPLVRHSAVRYLKTKGDFLMPTLDTHDASESSRARSARLEARITAEQKALFQRAAALAGRSLTDFVVSSVQEIAARLVREEQVMTLSDRDRKAFVAALLKPTGPGPRLRKAARHYNRVTR